MLHVSIILIFLASISQTARIWNLCSNVLMKDLRKLILAIINFPRNYLTLGICSGNSKLEKIHTTTDLDLTCINSEGMFDGLNEISGSYRMENGECSGMLFFSTTWRPYGKNTRWIFLPRLSRARNVRERRSTVFNKNQREPRALFFLSWNYGKISWKSKKLLINRNS